MVATIEANSSGLPSLGGKGTCLPSESCSSGGMAESMGVQKMPGAMDITRMPNMANSRAIGSVMAATAPLVAEYAAWPTWPSNAATDEVWMITPRSPSAPGAFDCMMAAAALSHRKVPIRLICTTLAKKSPAMGPFLPSTRPAPMTPAQFTSRLIPPIAARAACMAALTSSSEVTSHFAKLARLPIAVAAAAPGPSWTSNKHTRPPAPTMWRATALPRPEAPPVTTASASASFMGRSISDDAGPRYRPCFRRAESVHFECDGRGLAAADTQRRHAAAAASCTQCVRQRRNDACAGGADGMPERAGAAIDIGARVLESHVFHRGHGYHRERFVDFVQVHVTGFPAHLRQQFEDGAGGSRGEPLRLAREAGITQDFRQWFDAAALRLGCRHEHGRGRTVGNGGRRGRGHRPVLAEGGFERRDLGKVDGEGCLVLLHEGLTLAALDADGRDL